MIYIVPDRFVIIKKWELMSNNYPSIRLKELLKPVSRDEKVQPLKEYAILGAHWYAKGLYTKQVVQGSGIQANKVYKVKQGDFVYNRLFAWKGSFAVATAENDNCYVSNEFPCFEVREDELNSYYLWYYFSQEKIWSEALGLSSGSTPTSRNRLKIEKLFSMTIPLPPLAEQRRVVGRIEELAGKVEEARRLRDAAAGEAGLLLQSAKQTLFDPEDMQTQHWTEYALGDIAEIRSGVTLGRILSGSTIKLPYLRVANVQDGYLDLEEIKEVEIRETEFDKWQLERGDILLTEGGDWDKLGRGTVWEEEIPNCIHQNHIFRLRVDQTVFDPYFLLALISSPYGKTYFQGASKQTTNLASINQRQLKAFTVYKPSYERQQQIVSYLQDLQSKLAKLREMQELTQTELDALIPAILDKAFKGEL